MYKALIVTAFLALTFVPATASAGVDVCDTYGICVIARAGDDWACAGLGFGTQGIVACGEVQPACARVAIGFHREVVCVTTTLP